MTFRSSFRISFNVFQITLLQLLFVITASTQSSFPGRFTPLATASQPLKDSGIQVYVLGVGPDVNDQELNDIASRPQNAFKEPLNRLGSFGPELWNSWRDYIRNRGMLLVENLSVKSLFFSPANCL